MIEKKIKKEIEDIHFILKPPYFKGKKGSLI